MDSDQPKTITDGMPMRQPVNFDIYSASRVPSPLFILIAAAVVLGVTATLFTVIPVAADHWQYFSFSEAALMDLNASASYTVTRLPGTTNVFKAVHGSGTVNVTGTTYYLYPTYNGIWRLCDDMSDSDRAAIPTSADITTKNKCFTYVLDYDEEEAKWKEWAKQLGRLQYSIASCYIVVINDLCSAAVVGAFGIFQKQVASCMVTGVLYLMAAMFIVFGNSMYHVKDNYERNNCYVMDYLTPELCATRSVTLLHNIWLAWSGVIFCTVAGLLWLMVARALRVIKAKTML